MKIVCNGIVNGIVLDKYGKRGTEKKFGMPILSLPLKIEDAPKNTKSFAIIFDDIDCESGKNQFFIHWLVANLQKTEMKEDESQNSFDFIQGKNEWNENCYGGPTPPKGTHKYRLRVFALKSLLNLRGDFVLTQLENEMKNKVLDTASIFGTYQA